MNDFQFKSKVIVITDAASAFGKGCALKFAAGGASVVLAARRENRLDDLVLGCEVAGGHALAIPTDMTQETDVRQLTQTAISQFGRIDVWINNAGSGAVGIFDEIPLPDHIRVIQTDLVGTLYGSYFALQQFRRQGAGTLINVASVVGKVPSPYFSSYVAAKYGVVGLSASLRQELQEAKVDTIHVCTVMPNTFDTPFFEHAGQYAGRPAHPLPPAYDARDVVETIVGLVDNPRDEVSVGSAAKVSIIAHQLFPGLVESFMARETHKAEIENAEPQETGGTLPQPMGMGEGKGDWKR